jgi:hypothetical protein
VSAESAGLVHVRSSDPTANQFDNNASQGINIAAGALLQFDGGEANGNGANGIRLDPTSAPPPAIHTITALTANANPNNGVAVFGGSLKLRSSSLLANANNGLYFSTAGATTLDIGTAADLGANVFGGVTSPNNIGAGVFFCSTSSTPPTQLVAGNSWSACPPSWTTLATCTTLVNVYSDVITSSGVALTTSPCTVGP